MPSVMFRNNNLIKTRTRCHELYLYSQVKCKPELHALVMNGKINYKAKSVFCVIVWLSRFTFTALSVYHFVLDLL